MDSGQGCSSLYPRSPKRAASDVSRIGPRLPQLKHCALCPPGMALTKMGVFLWSQRAGCVLPREAQDIVAEPPGGYICLRSVNNLTTSEVIMVSEADRSIGQMAY